MSEFLLQKYKPIAEALLRRHHLCVDDDTRDMLAKNIMHDRELPASGVASGNSPIPALRVALTHAEKLLQYNDKPPARIESVSLRSQKLAEALRANGLVSWELALARPKFNPRKLLNQLDRGEPKRSELRRLLATLAAIDPENRRWKTGRPWAPFTRIVRGGCIAWLGAGRPIRPKWNTDSEVLSGPFAEFVRDLIACSNGSHELIRIMENERPKYSRSSPERKPRGDALKVSDTALRDAIREFRKWCKKNKQNFGPFSLDQDSFLSLP